MWVSICVKLHAQTTINSSNAYTYTDYTAIKGARLSPVIAFKAGKSLIDMNGMANVEQVANYLKNNSSKKIIIEGYTSADLDAESSQKLSTDRAEAVRSKLINTYGISSSRILASGKGIATADVMQLRKSGDAVIVYMQKEQEDRHKSAQHNVTRSKKGGATVSHSGNKNSTAGTGKRSGKQMEQDVTNWANNLMGKALVAGMVGVMTGQDRTCHSCWGAGCSDCNYTGKVFAVDMGLSSSVADAIVGDGSAPETSSNVAKKTTIKDGYRKVTLDNGDVLEGNFKNGVLNGQGKCYNSEGWKYVGSFRNSQIHGRGTLTTPWGDKYIGEFVDGEIHSGTHTFAGGKYIGKFKNGNFNGTGTLYLKDDKRYVKGVWKDGELVQEMASGPWNPTVSNTSTASKKTTTKKGK